MEGCDKMAKVCCGQVAVVLKLPDRWVGSNSRVVLAQESGVIGVTANTVYKYPDSVNPYAFMLIRGLSLHIQFVRWCQIGRT
jgi:hypothetical protein